MSTRDAATRRLDVVDATLCRQDGVISREQALTGGLSRVRVDRLVRAGTWSRALPGVYTVAVDPGSARARIWAAYLWAGVGAVLAGSAAAFWHGLTTGLSTIEIFVPPQRSRRAQPGVRLTRAVVPDGDLVTVRGLRLTDIPRTCLDLARWNRNDLLDVALRIQRVTRPELPASLGRSRHRRGQVRARRAVTAAMRNPWSRSELLAQRVLTDGGITGWIANARADQVAGKIHPDIAFETLKIAIEIDGRRFHDEVFNPAAFERDHERQLALARAGWFVIRVTVRQLMEQPELVVATIRAVIADRIAA